MSEEYDFVIVGSGAGGGPLAANLALAGYSVVVLEAGENSINDNYSVPAFHPLMSEDPNYSWNFFVKHYSEDNNPERDPKYHREGDEKGGPGILYPRASGVGGCTMHHAMITVYPHESDWNLIAEMTGDDTWAASNMRQYFDRMEDISYQDSNVVLDLLENLDNLLDPVSALGDLFSRLTARSGTDDGQRTSGAGWLPVTQADPKLLLKDKALLRIVAAAYAIAKRHDLDPLPGFDPNHPRVAKENLEGLNLVPVSVGGGLRRGSRERILEAQSLLNSPVGRSGKLEIKTNCLATNILWDEEDSLRAIGIEAIEGQSLYRAAHHSPEGGPMPAKVKYLAKKEVILCGGAFNTPQLLMLSGIGPAAELEAQSIKVRHNLPGVGRNLQDRYEVGVVGSTGHQFDLLEGAKFGASEDDPHMREWRATRTGVYATNGVLLGLIARSSTQSEADPPDLYLFGLPGDFRGYEVGYSSKTSDPGQFTWAVLSGHTDNQSGYVTLKSDDPRDTPEIHFKYFEESSEDFEADVQSVVDGVDLVLEMYDRLVDRGVMTSISSPSSAEREDLHTFVKDNAWGHHASCTCKIGDIERDGNAVLSSDFKVHGTKNLRVVDASVFPRIPGLFIVSSVYMVSEKASDVIIAEHRRRP